MGLEKIINKIEKEGDKEIKDIELEGEHQAEQIIKDAKKNAEEFTKIKTNETKKLIENLHIQEKSIIELEAKKIRLNTEKEILDTLYKECLNKLNSIQHKNVLSSLLLKVKKDMPEATYIYSNKRDEDTVRSISNYIYSGNINCIGGIIVENKDKTVRLDYRYETIAEKIWNDYLKEIVDKLFR